MSRYLIVLIHISNNTFSPDIIKIKNEKKNNVKTIFNNCDCNIIDFILLTKYELYE